MWIFDFSVIQIFREIGFWNSKWQNFSYVLIKNAIGKWDFWPQSYGPRLISSKRTRAYKVNWIVCSKMMKGIDVRRLRCYLIFLTLWKSGFVSLFLGQFSIKSKKLHSLKLISKAFERCFGLYKFFRETKLCNWC